MDAIKDIIPQVLGPMAQGQANPMAIAQTWERLGGHPGQTRVVSLKDGCLSIHVDCSARLVRLTQEKQRILEALRQHHSSITDIRFKVGKI